MDKYAVSDKSDLQKKEIKEVESRLKALRKSHEKTASETKESERLEVRLSELKMELADQ